MWKWNTVCHATAPHELTRFTPSAPRRSFIRAASRCEATITACRSSAEALSRSATCSRGTTNACPRVAGAMSRKATVCSSSSTTLDGSSPARILQKMQSGSRIGTAHRLVRAPAQLRAGQLQRLGAGGYLAGVLRRGELFQQLAHARAGGDAELTRQLVAS